MGNLVAGVSKANITPYVGIWLCGFGARFKPSENVYDELYARAIVFDDGSENIALVTCDILTLDEKSIESIRNHVQNMTGLKGENVFISTTHTHSGPLSSHLRGFGPLDLSWVDILEKKIAGAVAAAYRNMQEVSIGAGKGLAKINRNRRGGKAIDHEMGIIKVDKLDGKTLAVIMNYPCHPVIVPWDAHTISADYPGYAAEVIEMAYEGALGMFFNGTCGNINPLSVCSSFEETKRLGTIVGAEALKVSKEITAMSSEISLRAEKEKITLHSQEIPSVEELQEIVNAGSKAENPSLDWQYQWAVDAIEYAKTGKFSSDITIEIQALALGSDIAFVGFPGEVFVEIGLEIKEKSPFTYTLPVECTNGCIGYMPTYEAFIEGGYEPALAFKLFGIYPVDVNVAEKVTNSAINLLKKS